MRRLLSLIALCLALVLGASPSFAADADHGGQIFSANCAACHMGGGNVVNAERTLKKEALESYLANYSAIGQAAAIPCPNTVGTYYTTADDPSCPTAPCSNAPANTAYNSAFSTSNACPWSCAAGYISLGGVCVLPPPPPSPPSPPPPSPPPLPVQAFFPVVACSGVTHRFTAAPLTAGTPSSAADAVAGSTWSLSTAYASGSAATSPHTGAAMLTAASAVPSAYDAYSVGQLAWELHNANGFTLAPGATPGSLGGPSGFSIAVWFRTDDAGGSNPTQNVVLQLVLAAPGGGGTNVTLSLTVKQVGVTPVVSLNAKLCCGAGGAATSDADYAVSSSTDEFQPPPNSGFAVGVWQHVVVAFDAAGVQSGLIWNGVKRACPQNWYRDPLACADQRALFIPPPQRTPRPTGRPWTSARCWVCRRRTAPCWAALWATT
jgi:cytochrome c6